MSESNQIALDGKPVLALRKNTEASLANAATRRTRDVKLPNDALTAGLIGRSALSRRIRRADGEEARAAKFAKEFSGWLVPSLTRCSPRSGSGLAFTSTRPSRPIIFHILPPHSLSLSLSVTVDISPSLSLILCSVQRQSD